jgi:LPXTG-site transpeptidase (sortase) family protein
MRFHHQYILVTLAFLAATMIPVSAFADDGPAFYGAVHQTWIKPSPGNPGAEFGNIVAMDGDTLVVGARHDSVTVGVNPVYYAGAVYVYVLEDNTWSLQGRLRASDAQAYDLFGSSVDIDGDTLIVGAVGNDSIDENDEDAPDMGAVYIFTRSGDQWQQDTKIEPEDGIEGDNFGNAVSIVGSRIVVAASAKDIGLVPNAGKVYSYYLSGTKWLQSQSVSMSPVGLNSFFGSSLDYDGQRLVVGAQAVSDSGAVYVYYRVGSQWEEEAVIESMVDREGDNFGTSVSIDGQTIVVGAPFSNPNLGGRTITNAGAAYVFHKQGTSWDQEAMLVLENAAAFDHFGQSVSIDDTMIVVGASAQDYFTILRTGSAHVFERNAGEWELQTSIISGEPYMDADFGASLSIDDELIVIGEPGTSTQSQPGTVHLYSLEEGVLPATGFVPGIQAPASNLGQQVIASGQSIQIEIPELSLHTQVVGVQRQGNQWDVNWLTTTVGHLAGTAFPSHIGNTVIAGHVNLPDGSQGPFAAIDQLQWGDEIILQLEGNQLVYEVRSIYTTTPNDLEVLEKSDGYDWVTLITCTNFQEHSNSYSQRVIVEAVRTR